MSFCSAPRSAYDNAIRGQSKIHALPTSQITHLLKVIDQVREGQVNIRDLDRRDMNSINGLMKSFGMLHQQWRNFHPYKSSRSTQSNFQPVLSRKLISYENIVALQNRIKQHDELLLHGSGSWLKIANYFLNIRKFCNFCRLFPLLLHHYDYRIFTPCFWWYISSRVCSLYSTKILKSILLTFITISRKVFGCFGVASR